MLGRRDVLLGGALLLASARARVSRGAPTDAPVIEPDVRAAVVRGPARVLVDLRVPSPPAGDTDPAATRGAAILATRQTVLARLTGTSYRLVRQYATVPLLALEIGPDALAILETMGDAVTRVRLDRPRPPVTPR